MMNGGLTSLLGISGMVFVDFAERQGSIHWVIALVIAAYFAMLLGRGVSRLIGD